MRNEIHTTQEMWHESPKRGNELRNKQAKMLLLSRIMEEKGAKIKYI